MEALINGKRCSNRKIVIVTDDRGNLGIEALRLNASDEIETHMALSGEVIYGAAAPFAEIEVSMETVREINSLIGDDPFGVYITYEYNGRSFSHILKGCRVSTVSTNGRTSFMVLNPMCIEWSQT